MAVLTIVGIASAVCLVVYLYIIPSIRFVLDIRRIGKRLEVFPCPYDTFHWIFGHIPYHPGMNHEGLMHHIKEMRKYPRCAVAYFGSLRPELSLCHPETVKQLLKTAEPKTTEVFLGYRFLMDWIGDGLLLSKGEKWFRNRRLLTPGFHFDILKPYVKIYNSCVDQLIEKFDFVANSGKSVEIFDPVSLCTLDIILKCALSHTEDVQTQGDGSPYVHTVKVLSELVINRAFKPWLFFDRIYYLTSDGRKFKQYCQQSHDMAMKMIRRRRDVLKTHGEETMLHAKRYVDFLDILLLAKDENEVPLTDKEIRDEVETFMFEGHDTTKSGISFLLYNLARHPDVQSRARQEIRDLMVGRPGEEILWEDLPCMPYLTRCIKESLRLHPPVFTISRLISQPLVIDGVELLPGTIVDIGIWGVHHNPTVWGDNVMEYDPERFSEENVSKMDPHAFIPFAAGPRNCIGQNFAMNEMKVAAARILNKYRMSVDESVEVRLKPEVVLKTENGINLYFEPV